MLGNFSKFVRPGAVRVGVGGHMPAAVLVSAYENKSGQVVIVAINRHQSATTFSASISDARQISRMVPWITSVADNLTPKGEIAVTSGSFTYILPARSVTTFVSK
jgi:O-glycosyl hydrolase